MSSLLLAIALLVDPQTYVGNVYGAVASASGEPIAGAVVVLDECGCSGTTDAAGRFLINSVPAPNDGRDYTVRVMREGYARVVSTAHVLPGATMALEMNVTLDRGSSSASFGYRHERAAASRRTPTVEGYVKRIFATREGLVGGTTANGHVIVPNDRFVALPSRRALSTNFGHEHEVRVTYQGRTTVAPVWDIGPWNIHDDYWNPTVIRETFKDLPRGKPEAEAAFYDGYNGGHDERGRVVRTPAGIDLADGTFWIDLAMVPNDWVEVEFLWVEAPKRRAVRH